jgi:hypothetical protein
VDHLKLNPNYNSICNFQGVSDIVALLGNSLSGYAQLSASGTAGKDFENELTFCP